jgi:hypothetical protein
MCSELAFHTVIRTGRGKRFPRRISAVESDVPAFNGVGGRVSNGINQTPTRIEQPEISSVVPELGSGAVERYEQ